MGDNRTPQDEGLGTLVKRLFDEGKGYARAEADYYRALASAKLADTKTILLFGVIALVLTLAAAIGLIVGLLLIVSALLGPGWATLIVVGVTLLLAFLFGSLAASRFKRSFGGDA